MKHNHTLPGRLRILLGAAALSAVSFAGSAQVSASPERFSPLDAGYLERARTMMAAGNYAGVIDQLKHIENQPNALANLSEANRQELIYMLAEALYERGDAQCVNLLKAFYSEFPASPLALKARLAVGDFYFFRHDWPEALEAYEDIDFDRLNRSDLYLYSYRKGLSMIKAGIYKDARGYFSRISAIPEYKDAATFYNAYLDYVEGDYDKAYSGFARVPANEKGLEAGYYMTQIEYRRGEYDNVIAHGRSLLAKKPVQELIPETERVVGLSYFRNGDPDSAGIYLERYAEKVGKDISADASYALGVIDYNAGRYEAATERFSALTELNNELAQSAWLYMGQCDIKSGNPDAAAMAFEKAAKMTWDPKVTETALYNYAAAVTHGGNVPFSSSTELLENFIKSFPDSQYSPEVEKYLATAYYNERDYVKALKSIEAIRKPSNQVLAAKQKVLYELGVEAMNNGKPAEAKDYLSRSLKLASHDRELASQTYLWLGDALYSSADYSGALSAYNSYLKSAKNSSNRTLALYNIAYAEYMQKKYSAAAASFAKALKASPELPKPLGGDARIRMADCLYYTGDYRAALSNYSQAIDTGASDTDYAIYRRAVMYGLSGDISKKLSELSRLEQLYPESKWLPNALMETALTYQGMDRDDKAADAFRRLASSYPQSAQARKALISLALSYSKTDKGEKAAEAYKEVISRWPSSEEAQLANEDLRKYYASRGELAAYAEFLRSVPEAKQLDAGEMEQLAFDGAETAYADNIENILLLRNYVRDYPDGKYLAQALLDIAYSCRESKKYAEAETALSTLITRRPHSAQYPEALLMKAEILENNIPGRKADALAAYKELERSGSADFMADAYAGIMRTSEDSNEQIRYARLTRSSGGIDAGLAGEASLIEVKALMALGRDNEAVNILEELAANPSAEAGAEAAVMLGKHWLDKKEYSKAEQAMTAFTDAGTPHQYWLAKGFIILADAYHAQGRTPLAKEYLLSLKTNYPGKEKDIMSDINTRLKSWK